MRRVSMAGAILVLLLVTPAVFADDPPSGTEPPQMRIGPPGGVAATAEPPQMRIGPPIGETSTDDPPQVRIGPPGGAAVIDDPPSILELFWMWLQARISLPIG